MARAIVPAWLARQAPDLPHFGAMARLDAAFFDLGGVVMASGSAPGSSLEHFEGPISRRSIVALLMGPDDDGDHPWHRPSEVRSPSMAEAWPAIQAMLDEHGITRRGDRAGRTHDVQWLINEPVVDCCLQLREAGVRTSIVTNNVTEFRPRWWPALRSTSSSTTSSTPTRSACASRTPRSTSSRCERVGLDRRVPTVFLDDIDAQRRRAPARSGCTRSWSTTTRNRRSTSSSLSRSAELISVAVVRFASVGSCSLSLDNRYFAHPGGALRRRVRLLAVEVVAELLAALRMAQLRERLRLDLADALAGDAELTCRPLRACGLDRRRGRSADGRPPSRGR